MYVGFERVEIILPGIKNLKEKRRYLRSIKDRLKSTLNVSLSEINYHDLLQHSEIGICAVGRDRGYVKNVIDKATIIMQKHPQLQYIRKGMIIEKK